MKTKLLSVLITALLLLVPNVMFGQAPTLGVTSSFALFTGTGAFDNTGASYVTGDIGSNVSPITGFPNPGTVVGQTHQIDAVSAQASIDVNVAYGQLSGLSVFTVLGTTLGNGQTLNPGIYHTGAATTINGNLTLDGGGDPNALFIIKIGGALSTSTFSNVLLTGSASLCNVYWQVEGQFELGNNSVFRGTIIADGAINLLEGSSLLGRGLTRAGAISLHNNVVSAIMQPTASVITAGGAIALCAGGSVVLSGNVGGVWSNVAGSTTATLTVTTAGNYYVTNTNGCGSVTSNHIIVTMTPAPTASVITAGGATTFCAGGTVVLSGNVGGTWSNGATTATITVSVAGDYYVTNTNTCGSVTSNHIAVTVNPAATASVITAGGAIALCAGGSVVLSGNVGGVWSNVAGSTTATLTVTAAGNYYVTNTNGCGSVTSNHIVVTMNPAPTASVITAGGATTFCAGGNVVLSGNVGGTWSNGATTATTTVSVAGDYYVTNTNTCGSVTSNHIAVTVNPAATASVITAGGAIALCAGGSVVLSGNVGGVWSNVAGSTTATLTVTAAGNYYVTNTNGCGSVTSNHIIVTMNPSPLANAGTNATICSGNSATIGAASISGHTYSWTPTSGLNSATISNPLASPSVTTTYTLTETITATGCVASNSVVVTVNPLPTVSTATCVGGSVSFSANVLGVGMTYQWRNGTTNLVDGGNIFGATSGTLTISPVTMADASGNYNVVITGACSPNVAPLVVSLVVFDAPVIVAGPIDQAPCVGTSSSFSVNAAGIGLTYQWRNGNVNLTNGGTISGANSATLTINPVALSDVASNYNVVVSGACSLQKATSPNASLTLCNQTAMPVVAVNKVVSIYPNPSKSIINIELTDPSQINNAELKLYDTLGVMVMNSILNQKTTTLRTNNLPSGIYLYKVMDDTKTVQSGKLIFQ